MPSSTTISQTPTFAPTTTAEGAGGFAGSDYFPMGLDPLAEMPMPMTMDAEFANAMFAHPELYDPAAGAATDAPPDFSELWELLKPVIGDSVVPLPSSSDGAGGIARCAADDDASPAAQDGNAEAEQQFAIDPLKVAESVQSLLSGCAV